MTMRRLSSLKSCINLVKNVFVVQREVLSVIFWEGRPQERQKWRFFKGGKMLKCVENYLSIFILYKHKVHILYYVIFNNKFKFFVIFFFLPFHAEAWCFPQQIMLDLMFLLIPWQSLFIYYVFFSRRGTLCIVYEIWSWVNCGLRIINTLLWDQLQ
jgi:hypothetical protein